MRINYGWLSLWEKIDTVLWDHVRTCNGVIKLIFSNLGIWIPSSNKFELKFELDLKEEGALSKELVVREKLPRKRTHHVQCPPGRELLMFRK